MRTVEGRGVSPCGVVGELPPVTRPACDAAVPAHQSIRPGPPGDRADTRCDRLRWWPTPRTTPSISPSATSAPTGCGCCARSAMELVIGRREGYRIWDVDGRELLDLHLNGGVFNLGHRNPEVIAALVDALETLDIGNHHFPSVERAGSGRGPRPAAPPATCGTPCSPAAAARRSTWRSRPPAAPPAGAGSSRFARATTGTPGWRSPPGTSTRPQSFLSEGPADEFAHVPFDDLDAMAAALRGDDVAAVILETIPATSGFPMPAGRIPGRVKALCERHGALYIADEVQTGLGRTGTALGDRGARRHAGHPRDRQGAVRRALPDRGDAAVRAGRRVAARRTAGPTSRRSAAPRSAAASRGRSSTSRPGTPTAARMRTA